MPDLTTFAVFTHELDGSQAALLSRTIAHATEAQERIKFGLAGSCTLTTEQRKVSWTAADRSPQPKHPEIIVTGLPFSDNWFAHTDRNRTIITVADWHIAFDGPNAPPPAAPDAYLLLEFAVAAVLASIGIPEREAAHSTTTGCLGDFCENKPDLAIKLRSGYLCSRCKSLAAESGVSGVYLDAVQAILDRARLLSLGRSPQVTVPPSDNDNDDDDYIRRTAPPNDIIMPPPLVEALTSRRLTVLVGSGLSIQKDVSVTYRNLPWRNLPTWNETRTRLAERLHAYCGVEEPVRRTETLQQFLVDLEFFRERLGRDLYYPRAIFDIFLPEILSTGRANRLIFRLPLHWVLTTNYDFVLNFAAPPGTAAFTWRESRQALEYVERASNSPPILKLHGCASRADTVVLTSGEYHALAQDESYNALTKRVFSDHTVLFLGYGLNDPLDLDMALCSSRALGAAQGDKFALVHDQNATTLRERFPNVHFITYASHEDVPAFLAALVRSLPP